ncbi:hypothetical protein COXBURSA331_A0272 [Coxiella burnetii RSA 331]|nr:hypothetical protein COXBURSA331_A0272 [Coxiella burnetii RSA 331]
MLPSGVKEKHAILVDIAYGTRKIAIHFLNGIAL